MLMLTVIPLVLKYWKIGLIGIAALMIAGYGIHLDRAGYQRRVNEDKAQEIALLHERIATVSLVNSMDAQVALATSKLTSQLERLAFETPPNAGACLDRAAAGRVRAIQLPDPFAAPKTPGRYSGVLQSRSKRP